MTNSRLDSNTARPVAALLLAACLVAGCAAHSAPGTATPPSRAAAPAAPAMSDSIQITVERTSYEPGQTITLRLVNITGTTLGYNACTRELQVKRGDVWTVVPDSGRICTLDLRLLSPHTVQTATTSLPRRLGAGEYRVVLRFSPQEGSALKVSAVSNPFGVEERRAQRAPARSGSR